MRTILSLLLALLLSLGLALRALPAEEAAPALSEAAVMTADPETVARPGVSWGDMGYVHYDPEAFYRGTAELTDLAAGGDSEAAIALYDRLYDEFTAAVTYSAIAYIHYSEDVTDSWWTGENNYCSALVTRMGDALATACHELAAGPCGDSFAAHVGADAAEAYAGYTPMTDRELELMARESELVTAYYDAMAGAGDAAYTYMGERWDLDKLSGFPGKSLAQRDYQGYLEVFYSLQKAANDAAGPIFLELVDLRTELARLAGYESYTDYAYERIYGRDYAPADAQALCNEVKTFARDIRQAEKAAGAAPVGVALDAGTLTAALGRYTGELDPTPHEAWQFWSDNGLYSFSQNNHAMAGAYTVDLPRYGSAFIFERLNGDSDDFSTLTHEFGHFVNAWRAPCPDLLTDIGNLDLKETHSNGLEVLLSFFCEDLYGADGAAAQARTLGDLIGSVAEGCLYDEFQRRIYDAPDMTLDEINALFADLAGQYGRYEPMDVDYTWVRVLHNFEVPLYYISYAASALAAIQIWDLARTDLPAGTEAYMAVLDQGAYGAGYLDTLAACGLRPFTEAGAAAEICRPLLEYLTSQNDLS